MIAKRLTVLLLVFFRLISLYAQISNYNEIERKVSNYIEQGLFVSASNTLVELASTAQEQRDTVSALNYQLSNLRLVDEHIDYFRVNGLNEELYFSNWYATITLARYLEKREMATSLYVTMLKKINNAKSFSLRPFFVASLSHNLFDCCDSVYVNSLYLLQNTLDYIKNLPPSKELANHYITICECFFVNRFNCFYNSLRGNIPDSLSIQKLELLTECDLWFEENKNYIQNLDRDIYKEEKIRFYLDYCDILDPKASSYSLYESKSDLAIETFEMEINALQEIVRLEEAINQRIASCYAKIANCYLFQENLPKAKYYAEQSFPYLSNHNEDLDYCEILSTLSNVYWQCNNSEMAARLYGEMMMTKDKIGSEVLCSDYSLFMMYNSSDTEATIALGEFLIDKYGLTNSSMLDIICLLGDAYSTQMNSFQKVGNTLDATLYLQKADSCFANAEKIINNNLEYLKKYGLWANATATLLEKLSRHQIRKGDIANAFNIACKAAETRNGKNSSKYFIPSVLSAAIHDKAAISKYLPLYFNGAKQEIIQMLPLLGSVESQTYLRSGEHPIYRLYELASWNPNDSICVATSYDTALLLKGLYLGISSLAPYIKGTETIQNRYGLLINSRDSIFINNDFKQRLQLAYQYEIEERSIRMELIDEIEKSLMTSWENVQQSLSEDDVAIEFVSYQANDWTWCSDSTFIQYDAIIVDKKHNTPIYVNLVKQNEIISLYDNQPQAYSTKEANLLYHKIWDTIDLYIKGKKNVYFSPIGMLGLLNLECLTDESGSAASEKYNLRRLSSTKQIVNNVSDSVIMDNVTLFGGIDYQKNATNSLLDSLNTRGNWAYLTNTKKEVETIKKTLTKQTNKINLYSGQNASERTFKKMSNDSPDILHVSTHGYFIPFNKRDAIPYFKNNSIIESANDNLYYSGLALANGENAWKEGTFTLDTNDGVLSAYEITKLNLCNTDLVVLSACETALGERTFDGIAGLQRAFKMAGVQTIIMSLWKVDDLATSYFMNILYEEFVETGSKREAFNKAQKKTREKFKDPYYWAAFVMLD